MFFDLFYKSLLVLDDNIVKGGDILWMWKMKKLILG